MLIYTQNTFTMGYAGPRSVMDNLAFVCTHQKSRDKGGKIQQQTKGKSRTNNDPGDPLSFSRTATAPSLCWLPESVRGRLLHAAVSASHPKSPASHFQSKRRANARGRAELAPTTLAAASRVPHLKARLTAGGHRNLCQVVLRAWGPKSGLQVRVPSLPLGSGVT